MAALRYFLLQTLLLLVPVRRLSLLLSVLAATSIPLLLGQLQVGDWEVELRRATASASLPRAGAEEMSLCESLAPPKLSGFFPPPPAVLLVAQQVDPDRALDSIGRPRWYNQSEDRYSPPSVYPEPDNSIREHGWLAREKSASSNSSMRFPDFSWVPWNIGNWGLASDMFSALVLTVLAILIAVSLALLVFYSLRNYIPRSFRQSNSPGAIEIDPSRVIDLPFDAEQSSYQNPLEQAEALMNAGRYPEAIIYLYAYQLLALDRSRKIELHRGKTNRMYLRELRSEAQLLTIVQQTMVQFEAVFFGKHAIERESFVACWQLLPEFHRILAPAEAVPSARSTEVVPT